MPLDPAACYEEGKRSVTTLVRQATPEELEKMVPACPLWRVSDVVRHLTGVARAMVEGTMPVDLDAVEMWQSEEGTRRGNDFTDDHVAGRRDQDIEQVLAEWDQNTERLMPILRGEQKAPQDVPFMAIVPVTDIAAHLHDIRGALGKPGDRDTALVALAFASYWAGFSLRVASRGLPPVRVRYAGKERVTGEGEPAATWSGDRFELLRALAGRRSNAQIAAMDWEGDPSPYVPLISMYGPREEALVE